MEQHHFPFLWTNSAGPESLRQILARRMVSWGSRAINRRRLRPQEANDDDDAAADPINDRRLRRNVYRPRRPPLRRTTGTVLPPSIGSPSFTDSWKRSTDGLMLLSLVASVVVVLSSSLSSVASYAYVVGFVLRPLQQRIILYIWSAGEMSANPSASIATKSNRFEVVQGLRCEIRQTHRQTTRLLFWPRS